MRELISPWAQHLYSFYEYKKLCGYKYESAESVLYMFDRYYAELGIEELRFSRDIIEPFIYLEPGERIGTQAGKASILRQFGKYLFINEIIDNVYIIPPISRKGEKEYIPYIYEKGELIAIIEYFENYEISDISGEFKPLPNTLNAVTIAVKILMSTGMRIGEVVNLKMNNIDFDHNLFYIDVAKNDNQRIVPISETLKLEISNYIYKTPFNISKNDFLLYVNAGNRIKYSNISYYFKRALEACDIKQKNECRKRLHDLRHTFAVMSLTQLQQTEENINLSLSYLSTYLGHKSIYETQKYIWLTPILFKDIKNRMENYSQFIMDIFDEGEKFDEED